MSPIDRLNGVIRNKDNRNSRIDFECYTEAVADISSTVQKGSQKIEVMTQILKDARAQRLKANSCFN
jgi:hypothetical protein